MKFILQPYNLQELGQRQNQEDSLFPALGKCNANDRLFILCDGMGGHEKGEVASATVCQAMRDAILSRWNPSEPLSDELLLQAIAEAYDALDAKDNGEEKKMGTTMTFLCFHAEGVTVAHIGDSRVYQLRPQGAVRKGFKKEKWPAQIMFKTRDHSLVNDLIDIGEITEEEAKDHPQKNVITRAMQPCQERRAKATIAHITDVREGDYFYMCSDGMLEQTTDDNLLFIVTNPKSTNEEKVEMLRNVTEENKDNHTAHLIQVTKVEDTVPTPKPAIPSSPKGVWVTPEPEKQKRTKQSLYFGIATIIAIVFAAVALFLNSSKPEETTVEEPAPTESIRPASMRKPKPHNVTPVKTEVSKPETNEPVDKEDEVKEEPAKEPKKVDTSRFLRKVEQSSTSKPADDKPSKEE